jgi:hypothetical protein
VNRHPPADPCCPVVELRQYTLAPGRRDELIEIFDRHFVEGQEAVGMTVIGQFRDLQRPDRFVWLRGFADMEARRRALEAFYDGPIWIAHKDAANDTMLAWDDVLLLRPARPDTAFGVGPDAVATTRDGRATVLAGIYQLPQAADEDLVSRFEREVVPVLEAKEVGIEGVFVTEPAPNTFTRLPVREGEHVLAWFGIADGAAEPSHGSEVAEELALDGVPPSLLWLEPTRGRRTGS